MVSAKCVVSGLVRLALLALFGYWAWSIRLHAIEVYGRVIHEFDPWFNFRATQYYSEHGWEAFSTWYDDKRYENSSPKLLMLLLLLEIQPLCQTWCIGVLLS